MREGPPDRMPDGASGGLASGNEAVPGARCGKPATPESSHAMSHGEPGSHQSHHAHRGMEGHHFDPVAFLSREAERLKRVEASERVREILALVPEDGLVVDVGAGVGSFALRLAERLPRGRVLAVDRQADMVEEINRRAKEAGILNLDTLTGNAGTLPIQEGGADLVLFSLVLHDIPDPRKALREARRLLRRGGFTYLIEFVPGATDVGPPAEILFTPERVEGFLAEAGFAKIAREMGPGPFYRVTGQVPAGMPLGEPPGGDD